MDRPRIFVASSAEGLSVAKPLVEFLRDGADARLWKGDGVFKPGTYTLETFEEELRNINFAVIVATPDDILVKRGNVDLAVRDNLLFEFGLFVGMLGRRRTFLVVSAGADLTLPSDLAGLSLVKYDFESACAGERERIRVVQRIASDLRDAVDAQWGRAHALDAENQRKLRASARFTAMNRLQGVIVQLRDLLIELPTNALAALGDRRKFDRVKNEGVERIERLYQSWAPDAEIVGVKNHFDKLARATRSAIEDFPYPESVLVSKRDLQRSLSSLAAAGASALRSGDSPIGAVRAEAEAGLEERLRTVQEQYATWWAAHSEKLRRCTIELQDALLSAAVALGTSSLSA